MEVCSYSSDDRTPDDLNPMFRTIYKEPFSVQDSTATQFYNKKVCSLRLLPEQMTKEFLAFKLTVFANFDNAQGMVPLLKDFYLEGFSVIDSVKVVREAPPKCECSIF